MEVTLALFFLEMFITIRKSHLNVLKVWYANFKKSLCSSLPFSHQETQDGVVN